MNSIITLKNITKIFGENHSTRRIALKNINLEINENEFFIFIGPSGSGKSTLLRIISGLEKKYGGEVIFGNGIKKSDFSFVFQQFALLPWLTVSENIALGLIAHGIPLKNRLKRVGLELKRFGLEKFANSHIKELSGGMRQRVGIARALATDPKIIFLDEPFSELDSFTAEELRQDLLKIWQETKITIVMVTHIIEEALELSDRIAVLTKSPGTIEKIVVNNLARPRQKRSQDFYNLEDELHKIIKP